MAEKITFSNKRLHVPTTPIIPYIQGDGIGVDIWPAVRNVVDAACALHGKQIKWEEVYAGEKSFNESGEWLPQKTIDTLYSHYVGIKGPLTTPVGGGMRSLNVALRKKLDLFACVRPVRYYAGIPSTHTKAENVNMVIFRENTEDIYAGIEFKQGEQQTLELLKLLGTKNKNIRFPETSNFGLKPISKQGTERLIKSALDYALTNDKPSVTIVHKGNIMKFTEGAFKNWAYLFAKENYRSKIVTEKESWVLSNYDAQNNLSIREHAQKIESNFDMMTAGQQETVMQEVREALKLVPTHADDRWKNKLLIKDVIADAFLQQIILRPENYSVIATMNLNGDYISDALAALVGGIGIAPGANINYTTGHAVFEATHGTAPKYAGQDKVNPGSLLLSAVMMLEYIGWNPIADSIVQAMQKTIADTIVTYDFARLMPQAKEVSTSGFAKAIIARLQ